MACAVLIGSGAVRSWQARRIEGALRRGLRQSFDLTGLPNDLGQWRGESTRLDPQIARGTGADQVVTRRYVNQTTGVAVDAILLFGPAVQMYIHMPENCYPSAGYVQVAGPDAKRVRAGGREFPFRALVYSKGEGARADLQEVYYSWHYNGKWSPEVGAQKHFERISGMYKVHLARRVTPGEKRDEENPCESLLQALLPEMERRMSPPPSPSA
jgi:hypothetical protein